MLFIFVTLQIILTVTADQFHKYPYVFLLDVGNEEIDKTNTEQIRVNAPGGSLALKYPATDGADTITHVRVSGVDFGTDLKANIIEGGPGYKYVVLVFMGNPGVPYDAVVTIETVNVDMTDTSSITKDNYLEVPNDSSEDMDDENSDTKENSAQPKPDLFNYYNIRENNYNSDGNDDSVTTVIKNEDGYNGDDGKQINENIDTSNSNTYAKYEAFRPGLYGGAKIYPQAAAYVEGSNIEPAFDPENHDEEVSLDDSVSSDNKYTDSNNNINSDYNYSTDY